VITVTAIRDLLLAAAATAAPEDGPRAANQGGAGFPPGLTAVRVVLRAGGRAKATARFTPDVPGPTEPTDAQCEPTAYTVRVTPPGGGTLIAPVEPPTPVCVHGRISLSALSPA
jgi:hypothetical protein